MVLVLAALGALTSAGYASGLADPPSPPVTVSDTPPAAISTPTPAAVPQRTLPVFASAAPMARSVPTRLRIPAIEVDSHLMALGLEHDGTLETPPGAFPAGWFTGAPTPGELGPAVIAGHVRYQQPGVFARLAELRRHDLISVTRSDGSRAHFQVTHVGHFAKAAFPTDKVYGDLDHAALRLITCGGLDSKTNEFEENVVVFARLVTIERGR